jgi:hypothetical protein
MPADELKHHLLRGDRVGVDAGQALDLDLAARLLERLSDQRGDQVFAQLDLAAGALPAAPLGFESKAWFKDA